MGSRAVRFGLAGADPRRSGRGRYSPVAKRRHCDISIAIETVWKLDHNPISLCLLQFGISKIIYEGIYEGISKIIYEGIYEGMYILCGQGFLR
jgi:hypothetical protein